MWILCECKWCGLGFNPTPSYANLYALAVYDSALVIGGSFAALDGDTMNYVAKWIGGDYVDTCSTPVGVSEINSNDLNFSLSPNPASTQINLYSDQLITQVNNSTPDVGGGSHQKLCKHQHLRTGSSKANLLQQ